MSSEEPTALGHQQQVKDASSINECSRSGRPIDGEEKLSSPERYNQSIQSRFHSFRLLKFYFSWSMGLVGAVATFIRSDESKGKKRALYGMFTFAMILQASEIMLFLETRLERSVNNDQSLGRDRAIVHYVLKDPVLSFGYVAFISFVLYCAFVCPVDFIWSTDLYIYVTLTMVFIDYAFRYFSSRNGTNPTSSSPLHERESTSTNEAEEQLLEIEDYELLLETTLGENDAAMRLAESASSVIENYKIKANQNMRKYKTFRFVFPITSMLIFLLKTLWVTRTKPLARVHVFVMNELLISTSFYILGRLNNKRRHDILDDYVRDYVRVAKNQEKISLSEERFKKRFSAYWYTFCYTLYMALGNIQDYNSCFINFCVVLFLMLKTNKVTTGSYLRFRTQIKANNNRV
ncbi:hypothetical protein KGF57_003150 [Candida theae]|uniref:Uncharacterized protein n=1 Tax=Candida theae TaxID=1198502 RepID=A0AAD5FXV2_9ASCO|nr:uncharacterized protein KGF57_003150 [Candida theae]KAI5957456.1 hypothetical protein KGF57_003150 [Candida theae]